MPDLQSELNKILAAGQFDDDEGKKPATVVTDSPKGLAADAEDGNLRQRAWRYIKDNPGSTVRDIASALNTSTPNIAGGLHKMYTRGNLSRVHHSDGSGYHYSAVGDSYDVLSVQDRVLLMQKARWNNLNKAKDVKQPKPKPIKWVEDKPKAPAAFDADAILANLNVLQARELMDKLRKLFGV